MYQPEGMPPPMTPIDEETMFGHQRPMQGPYERYSTDGQMKMAEPGQQLDSDQHEEFYLVDENGQPIIGYEYAEEGEEAVGSQYNPGTRNS